jgi:ABC-2 type transport system ATP-binding protein
LVFPTSGTHTLLGEQHGAAALPRVGALVEGPGFFPYLSGRDNLRVLARYRGLPDSVVQPALEQVDLAGRAGDRFKAYSLGMKQRLGVAAALLGDPDLLVLDEPTNGLDPAGMADMRMLIRRLGAAGSTVLLSSHLLGEVQQICDRVGIINAGRMVAEHNVDELRGEQELVVRATPKDKAQAILTRFGSVHQYDDTLRVQVDPARAAEVNRTLVEAGIEVSELHTTERALEDIFFELTTSKEKTDVG